jgi:ABC-type multidrug transport system fused ATPase/permease subunit
MRAIYQLLRDVLWCLWVLRPHLRPGRGLVFAVVFCSFLSAPLEVAGVGMLLPMLAFLQGDDSQKAELLNGRYLHYLKDAFPGASNSVYFGLLCGLIVLAVFTKNIVVYVGANLSAHLLSRCGDNLRKSLFRRVQAAPIRIFEEHKAGEISGVFTMETVRSVNAMDFVLGIFQRFAMGLFMLMVMLALSWQVTCAFLLMVAVVGALTGILHRKIKSAGGERMELFTKLGGRLIEGFSGIRVLRATHGQRAHVAGFDGVTSGIARVERQAARVAGLLLPISETVGVGGAMAIIVAAYHFLILQGRMPPANLLALGFILVRLLPLVGQLLGMLGQLGYNYAGLKEVQRWSELEQFPSAPFGVRSFAGIQSGVRFRDVTFRYPNGKVALDRVSFDVPAGKTVALVGASGSGKSTLASLLIRLREPSSGAIEVDGTNHWDFSAESWHGGMGVVEQEAFLFHETVRHNICIGAPSASDADIRRALDIAHLHDVISALPKGLETIVGERGTMLSGGQKQRLAIARALVRNPKLLVLDEATSALDNLSERQVQLALDAAREGRTSVVIAHRLSTIRNADRIVVLEHGRVVEEGTWKELADGTGPFRKLLEVARDGHLSESA